MLGRLGFVASVLSEDLTTSRTCRLRNATETRLREITAQNLGALRQVFLFLERHQIRLYRITSNLVPFASHPVNTTRWWEEFKDELCGLGERIRALGIRVSTHPGQFTVLNSPHPAIVRASIAELIYHARLMDALETDSACKIVLHVGGLYGGTERAALDRFSAAVNDLPDEVRRRLVVENDDRLFDAEEVLEVSRQTGIPVVFDWLHHLANPCSGPIREVVPQIFDTWTRKDGRPKIHLSSQADAAPAGAHADYVDPADLLAFLEVAPPGRAFDCMLEAKAKDKALLRLRNDLAALGIRELDDVPARGDVKATRRASDRSATMTARTKADRQLRK